MVDINELFEQGKLFDGRYKLIDPLSTAGGSADVWLAIDINTVDETGDESRATKVAIKIYRPKNLIDVEGEYQFRREFKKVFGCHHENIIQPTYFSVCEEMPYLVLPYCPSGSSEMLIGQIQSEKDYWKYIYEVASGLAYLHEHSPQIIHQDIKPANVLIDDNGNYAITDFGISVEMERNDEEAEEESGGTYAYMAPERFIEGTPPMPESDIWAFGATLYELITGDAPYGNEGGSRQSRSGEIPPIRGNVPDSIKQLVYSCLAYDAKNRPTAREIVDTVLKKRYSRNRKTVFGIGGGILLAVVGLTFILTDRNSGDPDAYLDSLMMSGDSIVEAEFRAMEGKGGPDMDNVSGLEKAKVMYAKVCRDAPSDYEGRDEALGRIEIVDRLVEEIEEYDRAHDLAEKARLTEMDEEFAEYSLIAENHKTFINQLIQQFK